MHDKQTWTTVLVFKLFIKTYLHPFTQNYATKPENSKSRHASFRSNQNSKYLHLNTGDPESWGRLPPLPKYCGGSIRARLRLPFLKELHFKMCVLLTWIYIEDCVLSNLAKFWPVVIKWMTNQLYMQYFLMYRGFSFTYFSHGRKTHTFHFKSFVNTILTRLRIIKCPP